MSGRFVVLLGIIGIGAAIGIAGMAQPASADLVFGTTDATGTTCIELSPPLACSAPGITLPSSQNWIQQGGSGIHVTSEGLTKNGFVGISQFLEPLAPGTVTQSGIGIAAPNGETDNEINNVAPAAPTGLPSGNFVSLDVTSPHAFSGTISIDSIQTGEQAEVCAEPTSNAFGPTGGANCVLTAVGNIAGTNTNQVLTLPAAYSAADPFLAVDAVNSLVPGVTSDVKISDLDVAVPEPGTVALVLTGMAGLVLARRRKNSI